MSINNSLSLLGKVVSQPKWIISPSGIEHCQFYLEHSSCRQEAGFKRQVWCKMPVQMSGEELIAQSQSITVGVNLLVVGFIISRKSANQISQLVLHAEQIEFID